ncbi:MAG: hypothetical protein C5B50_13830, partial [Verrucomicrobia bacterium]
ELEASQNQPRSYPRVGWASARPAKSKREKFALGRRFVKWLSEKVLTRVKGRVSEQGVAPIEAMG